MRFYEAIWHGKGIGDGSNLQDALAAYYHVKPDNDDWSQACSSPGANPHIEHFASFENYLDNDDPLESIPVTPSMIREAISLMSSSVTNSE